MKCERCKTFIDKYEKTIMDGRRVLKIDKRIYMDYPICAFDDRSRYFSHDNWCCQTLIQLRTLSIFRGYNDDESINVIPTSEGKYIILTYYKYRGATGNAIIMCDNEPIIPLTLELAEETLLNIENKEKSK